MKFSKLKYNLSLWNFNQQSVSFSNMHLNTFLVNMVGFWFSKSHQILLKDSMHNYYFLKKTLKYYKARWSLVAHPR